MTVIAWDGKTLAADRKMEMGGGQFPVRKIQRHEGLLIGSAGDLARAYEMVNWCLKGRQSGKLPPPVDGAYARLLVIQHDGPLIYANNEFPIDILLPYAAIGSGQDYAITAMHLGKTAKESVEVACQLCAGCGLGIDTLSF